MKMQGGCLCGKLRYVVGSEPASAGLCHCRLCQRSSGAPVMAWMTVSTEHFEYTEGAPSIFHSSRHAQREYCPACGTQIAFRSRDTLNSLDVTLNSLDDSSLIKPQYHIWTASKVDWLKLDDGLPQFLDAGPDS
ncbi:MAG TPA: GFA family protein [Pseudomonas xinjiangensis]|uniref:GFA family protein n=1 Tax=Halopseudomonas xinjiangensis TaxID=487184 RepID=A0A7V1FQW9_9GAMM|nr:GFA family protein [Halopseudomonas xinjiangensis]HEC47120.1 GFA family protein [Halopseudomonas xinjiangensis]